MIDLALRWKKARMSAVGGLLKTTSSPRHSEAHQAREEDLLKEVTDSELATKILRQVFDVSRALGVSASRFFGVSFENRDFVDLLRESGISCYSSSFVAQNESWVLERKGCSDFLQVAEAQPQSGFSLSRFFCEYWREALDGLVMGLGENERTARHESLGAGDSRCLDILYVEGSPGSKVNRYGVVPPLITQAFSDLSAQLQAQQYRLILEGYSEGTLFYQVESRQTKLCGTGGDLIHQVIASSAMKKFPGLKVKNVAPFAVEEKL
jgi:hypothetical protein